MKETPPLKSERLLLRPFTMDDAPSIYRWASSLNVTEYLFWYPHRDMETTERILRVWLRKKRHYSWAICLENDVIGEIEVIKDLEGQGAEIGYTSREDVWGHGYMSEALSIVVQFLFSTGYRFIYAETDSRNLKSKRLLNKFAFIEGESFPRYIDKKGVNVMITPFKLENKI